MLIHLTLDYNPTAVMFSPHHWSQVLVSDIGILFWLGAIGYSIFTYGFSTVFRLYLVPYLWYDPFLPNVLIRLLPTSVPAGLTISSS